MTKVTIAKFYRNTETLRVLELDEVAQKLQSNEYIKDITDLREEYPLLELQQKEDGSMSGAKRYTEKIPKLCFSAQMENRNHRRVILNYTGLVMLEVNNLTDYEEADAIRRGAGQIPQTLLAFVGASGRSVKIVCRGELFEGALPEGEEDIRRFHTNLYEKARMAYNVWLGVAVEKLEPMLERTCYLSYDPSLLYNPMAQPFYADLSDTTQVVQPRRQSPKKSDELLESARLWGSEQAVR